MNIQLQSGEAYMASGGMPFDKDQPSIVFIHGAAMDHTFWTLNTRYFARNGFNALAPDLPGHGRTSGEAPNKIADYTVWVVALLETMQLSDVILVGHSMGSLIALDVAAKYADRVKRIVLLGTALPMRVGPPLLEAAAKNDHSAFDMVSLFGTAFNSQLGFNPVAGLSVLNTSLRILEQSRPGTLFNALTACNDYQEGESAAAHLQCAATLIVGDRDMMTPPRAALKMAALIPNAEVVTLRECGHMHPAEQPETTHQALVKAIVA